MHISLKEFINNLGVDTTKKITEVQSIIDKYIPFFNSSSTVHFFQVEADKIINDIDWLDHVFVYDYMFQNQPNFSAMLTMGVKNEKLTELTLPNSDFIKLSLTDDNSDEVVVSAEIESINTLKLTLYDLKVILKDKNL